MTKASCLLAAMVIISILSSVRPVSSAPSIGGLHRSGNYIFITKDVLIGNNYTNYWHLKPIVPPFDILSGYEGPPNKQHNSNSKERHDPLCERIASRNKAAIPEPPPATWKILAFIFCGVSIAMAVLIALGQVVDRLTKKK